MTAASPIERISAAHARLAPRLGGGAAWARRRHAALGRLVERGLPGRHDENWKYLDHARIGEYAFDVEPAVAPGAGVGRRPTPRAPGCAPRRPGGRRTTRRTSTVGLPAGLEVVDLAALIERDPQAAIRHAARARRRRGRPLRAPRRRIRCRRRAHPGRTGPRAHGTGLSRARRDRGRSRGPPVARRHRRRRRQPLHAASSTSSPSASRRRSATSRPSSRSAKARRSATCACTSTAALPPRSRPGSCEPRRAAATNSICSRSADACCARISISCSRARRPPAGSTACFSPTASGRSIS